MLDEHDLLEQRLRRRYAVPPRSYHTFEHAATVAGVAASLGGGRACLLAAWFHDVVYDPGATDNEERSAEVLVEWIGAQDDDAPRAAQLVRMTAEHRPLPDDTEGAILSDADLAVLGGSPQAYERYREQVRAEFADVGDEDWAAGRGAVLRDLLDRDRLFLTDEAHERWEESARRNLRAELDALG